MKIVAYWNGDIAGSIMAEWLREQDLGGDVQLREFDHSLLYLESWGEELPEIMVVASRHRAESGKPTLTCHVTGNFGGADYGGKQGHLQQGHALYLRESLQALQRARERHSLQHAVSFEVTHHGPTDLPFPLIFVEVGSCEEQWHDNVACQAVAESILEIVRKEPSIVPTAIGFGGPHYAPNFTEALVASEIAFGHIAPKYAVDFINKAMIVQMIEKTVPKPELAILDWKGLKGEEKENITGILDELGFGWKKTRDFKH
ncbi:D-aminoacyl-tRNA deacylase [Candidatus Altiarchaeota archaeon]